ncbi:MAG: hypothetical protein IJW70_03225 [Clostridia bacterium]|nr:hypothetical protein [Clostridia bacterium]
MKRLLAILLVCAFIFSAMPVIVFAQDDVDAHQGVNPVDDQCDCDRNTRTGVYVKTVDPTCVSVKYEVWDCDECGLHYSVVIGPALGHLDELQISVTAPTCTEQGYTTYKCTREHCDLVYNDDYVPALGHTEDAVVTAPTCTTDGYTTYTCTVCGNVEVRDPVAATGHTPVTDDAVAPDCENTGLTEGSHCDVCGEILVGQDEVPALGHTPADAVVENNVDPQCEVAGSYDLVVYCSVCGDELSRETVTVPATKHDYIVTVTPATHTAPETEHYWCQVCGYEFTAETAPALGHDYDEGVVTAPTCTEQGYTTYTCTCGDVVVTDYVPALGHTPVTDAAVDPDCVNTGLTEGSHCDVCGEVLVAQQVIPALGHISGQTVIENKKAPTCQEDGSYDEVVYCTVCGDELSRNTVIVPASDLCHVTITTIDEVPATCVSTGMTRQLWCVLCEKFVAEPYEIPVNPDAHNYTSEVIAPTCTADGYTLYTCANGCGASYTDTPVSALGHEYDAVVTAPTCTVDGYTTYTCSVCGDTYVDDIVAAPGHAITNHDAKAPTCTEIGWDAYDTCDVCDYTTYVEKAALGHTYERTEGVVYATCTTGGYDVCLCSVCEQLYKTNFTEAKGHTAGDVVVENNVAPDCVNDGSYDNVVYCTVCGAELSRETITVEALGHTPVTDEAVAPDCVNTGLTEGSHCDVCGEILVAQEVVDALGHTPVTDAAVDPDCENTGLTEGSHCDRCGEILVAQEVVEALGHNPVTDEAVDPDCENTGLTEGSHCDRCGETLVAQEEIPANGHTEGEVQKETTVEQDFDEEGFHDEFVCCVECGKELSRTEGVSDGYKNEEIYFSYEATGINGVNTAVNSGYIYLNVYLNVETEQARLWGAQFQFDFDASIIQLVEVQYPKTETTVGLFASAQETDTAKANANGSVAIIQVMPGDQPDENVKFNQGQYWYATLVFKVDNNSYSTTQNEVIVGFDVSTFKFERATEKNELVMTQVPGDGYEASIKVVRLGDTNGDGELDIHDSKAFAAWYAGADTEVEYNASIDMDKDSLITALDYYLLNQAIVHNDEYLDYPKASE